MVESNTVEALQSIVSAHKWLRTYWDDGLPGWADRDASLLLERNRLDRLFELALALYTWKSPNLQSNGHLILAWSNLGALVEGTMKWFLCAYAATYSRDPVCRKDRPLDPDKLSFEAVREYFRTQNVWVSSTEQERDAFVRQVQHRRNAIHAYQDRDIGTFDEFWGHVRKYSVLLDDLIGRAPELPWVIVD